MTTDLRKYGTKLMRSLADRVSDGITTGPDWPNNQDELTRLQSARLLREAAAEIEFLRGWAHSAFRVINNVIGPLMVHSESETGAEQEMNEKLLEMAEAVAMQYPAVTGVEYTKACEDSRAALGEV